MSEKPFDPTPHRLERARREGDLPYTHELAGAFGFGAALLATAAIAMPLAALARTALVDATASVVSAAGYLTILAFAFAPCLLAAVVALAATLALNGMRSPRLPGIKFERLSPSAGLKRLCSRDTALAIARSMLVGACVGLALFAALRNSLDGVTNATPWVLAALVRGALGRIGAVALSAALASALLALGWERSKWRQRLRMSHDELRRELRQSEGDPLLRGRLRRSHGALVRGSIARLREAAFVVTNPTHVAVALAYRPPEIAVPLVLVRAVGVAAALVKERARLLGVPVVVEPAVARLLLECTQVDAYIPRSLYEAVARIVAELFRRRLLRA